ncbi:MAG: nuclear transport factor 2 family protein [Solirubrobacterales bacterium]|nr:nuclear transport factor 2 family protein [Solirubrobacterales bacterium]MBV9364307.1 nuclear transport factor 2 family protein [Solirubrobacterales bacterium]
MADRGDVIELVEAHVGAFNAGEVGRVLAGLATDVVWQTGSDEFVGLDDVERLLRGAAGLFPALEIKRVLVDGQRAAVEMIERYLHEGQAREVAIAVFFSFEGGLISRVKVFREGSADP